MTTFAPKRMAMVIMNDIAQTRNELIKIFTVTVIAMIIPFMQMSKLIDLRMHHLPDDARRKRCSPTPAASASARYS